MKSGFLLSAISIAIYILLIMGIWLLVGKSIARLIKLLTMINRINVRHEKNNRIIVYLDYFILASLGVKNKGKTCLYVVIAFTLVSVVCITNYTSFVYALMATFIILLIPYLMLSIRLEKFRTLGSLEGEVLVADLLSKYRLYKCNLDKTLDAMVQENKYRISGKFLGMCLSRLRQTGNKDQLINCGEVLAYGINTNWASMLAFNIGMAASEGTDISKGLEDIVIQLREARRLSEKRKRLNSEAGRLVLIAVPFTYLLTMFFSVKYMGVSLDAFLKQQFNSAEGLFLALVIVFLFLINTLIISLVNNKSFDY